MKKFRKILKNTAAASMVEFGLIAAGISVIAIPATKYLGINIQSAFAATARGLESSQDLITPPPESLKLVTLPIANSAVKQTAAYETQSGKLYSVSWQIDNQNATLYHDGYTVNPVSQSLDSSAYSFQNFSSDCRQNGGTATKISYTEFMCKITDFKFAENFAKYNANLDWYVQQESKS